MSTETQTEVDPNLETETSTETQQTQTTEETQPESSFGAMLAKALDGATIGDGGEIVKEESAEEETQTEETETKTEEPAKEETTEEKKPDEAALDAAEAKMDVKTGTAFKTVRSELKKARETQQQLESQIEELKAKAQAAEEATALKEKLSQYEEEIKATRFEATEEFQNEVVKPLDAALEGIAQIARKYEVPEADLVGAMREPDPNVRSDKLAEISANFNRIDIGRFDRLVDAAMELSVKREAMLSKKGELLQQFEAKKAAEAAQAAEREKSAWTNATESTFAKLQKEIPSFFKEGDPKVQQIRDFVKSVDFGKASPEDKAALAYKAASFPVVVQMLENLYKENQALTEKVGKITKATPKSGAGSSQAEVTPKAFGSFQEAMAASLAKVQL